MTRGIPWWSQEAPPIVARAPMKHGPYRCYQCWDTGWEDTLVAGVYKKSLPCSNPGCPVVADRVSARAAA
jgi:hypothetical protein